MWLATWLNVILFLVIAEAFVVTLWLYKRQQKQLARSVLVNLTAGACLITSIRFALVDQTVPLLMTLSGALIAHLVDLYLRLRAG
jgi:hypothetical protein